MSDVDSDAPQKGVLHHRKTASVALDIWCIDAERGPAAACVVELHIGRLDTGSLREQTYPQHSNFRRPRMPAGQDLRQRDMSANCLGRMASVHASNDMHMMCG